LTDLIAGPGIGAYSNSHFWPLLPCFWLVTTAVVLAAALQALVGRLATALVAVLFIFVGGSGMGGSGTFMLPVYWRNIGAVLPPQNGVSLVRNVLYFGGNDITTPLIVLFVYALAGLAVVSMLGWLRPARPAAAAHARGEVAEASPAGNPEASPPPGNPPANRPGRRRGMIAILVAQFENAASRTGQKVSVQQYTPTPLAPKDPLNLVVSLMLVPILIGGYISATMVMAATGKAAARWRAGTLAGFAVVAGLVVDLIVCYWLRGIPSSKFWIVWPVITLIIAVVAFFAAILQKLIGTAGTLLTVILIVLFGNNSSGGANGVPYLPAFWRDIGPFLPPRNGYILLHQTIYFSGHGTTQALTILLVYLGVTLVILGLLDWTGTERPVDPDMAEAAAVAVPAGAAL
jgi:hypothetical protein